MNSQIPASQRAELQRIWDALLHQALARGVPFQEAQDLVSNSLRNALEHHDSTRGELLPFSRTVLSNAIKNYFRDRKMDLPFDDELWHQEDDGPDVLFEEFERAESMKRTIEQLSRLLSPEELAFMKMLGQVVDELGDRAVSETARRLGLKPTKGWDLFRRIQRKAQSLETPAPTLIAGRIKRSGSERIQEAGPPPLAASVEKEMPEPTSKSRAPLFSAAMRELASVPADLLKIAGAMARQEAFERFMKSL